MSTDCLTSLFCFTTVALVFLGGWVIRQARRRLLALEARLALVETHLDLAQPVATVPARSPLPAEPPIAVASTPTPLSPDAPTIRTEPSSAQESAAFGTATASTTFTGHQPVEDEIDPTVQHQTPVVASEAASPPEAGVATTPAQPAWTTYPLIEWFINIHLMVQVGIIVLFFGVGFLVKYAVDQGLFPLEVRLASAALLGAALAAVGWRVRATRRVYGLALMGGGIGIVYLTTFGAYYFYHLLAAPVAFTLFVALSISYVVLALLNDAAILALMAVVGAFLAPLLAADGGGNHLILFSYYGVVNLGVLALARVKQWSHLNLASFCFSALAAVGWAVTAYSPAYFVSVMIFLTLFFAFYLLISLWAGLRETARTLDRADLIILFANPLVSFLLFAGLLHDQADWLATCALLFALLYGGVSYLMRWQAQQVPTRGAAPFVADVAFFFAALFLTIAIPLRFDAQVTAAIWSAMGTGLVWLSLRRDRPHDQPLLRGWGVLVHLLAMAAFAIDLFGTVAPPTIPFLNHLYVGTLLLGITTIMSAIFLQCYYRLQQPEQPKIVSPLALILVILGLLWWYGGGLGQFPLYATRLDRLAVLLFYVAVSGVIGEMIGRWVRWWPLRLTIVPLLPVATLLALYLFIQQIHPFTVGWYVWPVVLTVHLFMLQGWARVRGMAVFHAGGLWLGTGLLTWWAMRQAIAFDLAIGWYTVAFALVPVLVLLWLSVVPRMHPWPFNSNRWAYVTFGGTPIASGLMVGTGLAALFNAGDSAPLPFLPLLNPLDLTLVATVLVLWRWIRSTLTLTDARQAETRLQWARWWFALLILLFVNSAVARAIHHLTGTPYTWAALYDSALLQMTYALLWSILAFGLMATAHYRRTLQIWYIGAALLGLTIGKLFLIDLVHTGTLTRIISFIGVGLLTITVAYFWPAPPRRPLLSDG